MQLYQDMTNYYRQFWENPLDPRNLVFNELNDYVKLRIPSGVGKTAIDIGSGKGTILNYLVQKGYEVVALELDSALSSRLKWRFPTANVIRADVRRAELHGVFDLVTCIELTQNLTKEELSNLVLRLSKVGKRLLINISNPHSFHGCWTNYRGFRADFVTEHTIEELEELLARAGFRIFHRRGIGLLTPITLYPSFRVKLFPTCLARAINHFDKWFAEKCHLYYVEAVAQGLLKVPDR